MKRPAPRTHLAVIRSLLAVALVAGCSAAPRAAGREASGGGAGASSPVGYGPGMMGGWSGAAGQGPGMMGGWEPGSNATWVAVSRLRSLESAAPSSAVVDRVANRVSFTGALVTITILGAPPDGPDETFRIAGLVDPTIVVPAGAQITVQFVNADPGMAHDWLVTKAQPPFPYMAMMSGPSAFGAGSAVLPAASAAQMPAATLTFRARSAGSYTYLCSVPGHAQEGMYGAFIVA